MNLGDLGWGEYLGATEDNGLDDLGVYLKFLFVGNERTAKERLKLLQGCGSLGAVVENTLKGHEQG